MTVRCSILSNSQPPLATIAARVVTPMAVRCSILSNSQPPLATIAARVVTPMTVRCSILSNSQPPLATIAARVVAPMAVRCSFEHDFAAPPAIGITPSLRLKHCREWGQYHTFRVFLLSSSQPPLASRSNPTPFGYSYSPPVVAIRHATTLKASARAAFLLLVWPLVPMLLMPPRNTGGLRPCSILTARMASCPHATDATSQH
jgi:hypothetical protein